MTYGPWINHDGKGCPCLGMWVHSVHCNGMEFEGIAGSQGGQSWDWSNYQRYSRIVRYRIRKPKGMEVIDQIMRKIATLPAPDTVTARYLDKVNQ